MRNGSLFDMLGSVRHGLMLSTLALILGICWAGYLGVNHEQLHGGFEKQEAMHKHAQTGPGIATMMLGIAIPDANAHGDDPLPSEEAGHTNHEQAAPTHQHSHSGSLATDAMQRLLRGHIHWMGVGTLSAVMLLIVAFTSLKSCGKKLLGWTFGIGALAYPPAWILMGFRTVELGPQAAEASVVWLFGPAAGLLLASMVAMFGILTIEMFQLQQRISFLSHFFQQENP